MTVSRSQLFDWVIVAVVIIATYWLEVSNLFFCQPYSADDPTISYPLVPNTIRSSMLVLLVMAPMCLVLVIHILGWTSTYELHNTVLGYTQSIVTANAITTALKLYVGRLRPDFLDRLRQAGYTKVQIENGVCGPIAVSGISGPAPSMHNGPRPPKGRVQHMTCV